MSTFPAGLPHGSRARRNFIVALALASTALVALAAQPSLAAGTLPTGGAFAAGAGTISSTSSGLAINQTSARGIITWQDFSIGAGELVQFNNGAGATLNRVTGTDISTIAGMLRATGSVYLVNPYGVMIAPGGQVITTGSFVASTRDLANTAFMQGGTLEFQGTSAGTVVNQGTITSSSGDVFLIGQSVENDGQISAANGTAGLAAGDDVLLQPATGDQRIFISAGAGDVTNTGTIAAAQAELNAAGGNVYALAGNTGGVVSATGTATVNGHVWLTAGQNIDVAGTVSAKNADGSGGEVDMAAGASSGTLTVSGTVDTSSAIGNGGTVTMTAADVSLAGTAVVTASGAANGGVVLIGGDRGGGSDPSLDLLPAPVADAQQTSVAAGASITADAGAGNGGSVVVWSEQNTSFAGSIAASGGGQGGNGGFVEVSGEQGLDFDGTVDTRAPFGQTGTLLLDPNVDITIAASGTSGVTCDGISTCSSTVSGSSAALLVSALETALGENSVDVVTTDANGTGTGSITVSNAVSWTNVNALTLTAAPGAGITIGSSGSLINTGGANITLIGDTLTLPSTSSTVISTTGTVTIAPATSTTAINIGTGSGLVLAATGKGSVKNIAASTLVIGAASVGGIPTTGTISVNAALKSGGSGGLTNVTNLELVSGSGDISLDDAITLSSTGVFTLGTAGSMTQSAEISLSGTGSGLVLEGGGDFALTESTNNITMVAGSADSIDLVDSVALTVGTVGGVSNLVSTGSGGITLDDSASGGIATAASTGTISSSGTGPITLEAKALTLDGSVTASGQTVTILSSAAGTAMSLAGSSALDLSQSELDGITASTLIFGSTGSTGAMTVGGTVTLPTSITNLELITAATGGLTFSSGAVLTDGDAGGNITIEVNKLTLTSSGSGVAATGSGGTVTILPETASTTTGIGSGTGTLVLSTTALGNITASTLIVGSTATTGTTTVGGTVTLPSTITNLDLVSGASTLTFSASAVLTDGNSGGNITLEANGITLTNAGSAVKATGIGGTVTILPATATSTMSIAGSSTLNLTQTGLNNITASTLIFGSLSGDGTANATATGDFTVGGAITVPSSIGTLEIETACPAACSASTGIITISNGGSIKTSIGGSVILADGNEFVNDDGSGALVASGTNARWLVYSQDPANDTKGGLVYAFKQYDTALLGALNGAISSDQSGFIYTAAPTATVSLVGTVSKTYDGTTTATLSAANYSVGASGDPNDPDTVVVNDPTTGTFGQADVDNGITVSVTGLSIVSVTDSTGASVYGYGLSSSSASAAIGMITPAALTITADSTSKTYGQTVNFAGTEFTATGLVNGDSVGSVTLTSLGAAATADVTATPYTITASAPVGSGLGNYIITYDPGFLTVNPAALTITADSTSKTYGQTVSFAGTEFTATGLVNGDSVGSVTLTSLGAAATADVTATPYTITPSAAVGSGLGNYIITYDPGFLTVNPAALTITADSTSKTYGQTVNFAGTEFTATGLVNSDSVGSVTLTSLGAAATADVTATPYTITPSAAVGSGLGNYIITYDPGFLTVNPAALTITADSTSKTYGQTVSFAGTEFTATGLVNSDSVGSVTLTSLGAAATADVTATPYTITPSAAVGSGLGNYIITYEPGFLTVNPAALTIAANNEAMVLGAATLPALTVSYSGFVVGDSSGVLDPGPTVTTAATVDSPVGSYRISGTGAADPNYAISYVAGLLTISAPSSSSSSPSSTSAPPLSTPSAASLIVSTVLPSTPTIATNTPVAPLGLAPGGAFSLDILAQQLNAIAPAAGGNGNLVPTAVEVRPRLNVVCSATGDTVLTVACTGG